ncbi:MAG: hypothetical protein D6729_16940 [Deltaproteobacteria bacterium]|nr:MAG: hypothetical protein D6729_16940 [Deltaproteobacteria bacterium]
MHSQARNGKAGNRGARVRRPRRGGARGRSEPSAAPAALVRAALVLGALWLATGCGGSPSAYQPGQSDFVSADPWAGGVSADAGGTPERGAPAEDGGQDGSAERQVEEADIVRLLGNYLYVLNTYRGLQVIDLSDPDQPELVGMAEVYGRPVEMYVRDDRAYVVVSNYYTYAWMEDVVGVSGFRGSQIKVFDLSDPASPAELGSFDVEGDISDTRIVGDVLYAVSSTYGAYWDYGPGGTPPEDATYVVSIDLSDPQDIHLVETRAFPRQGWSHYVHVTSKAIYLASTGWSGSSYETRIKYVDISDPTGRIQLGGETVVPGMLRDRWMMDEYDGVLRVVSAPDGWGGGAPEVRTYAYANGAFTLLGATSLVLPQPESLTAVRFDGPRAYVVTYERVDPLFVVDLSDPSHPTQRGAIEMPGWLDHIVPRGDRLVALGHDDTSGQWQLAVSLFDVSDLDAPALLDRVSFGGGWGWVPDERDNYDKVFKVLDALNLVMVPFHSYRFDESTGYWSQLGGVQLIDFQRDDLVLRGLVEHAGWVRRAVPAGTRILTVSNERLQVVDASDRDAPAITAELELARNVLDFAVLGEYGVQLVGDWYRGDTRLLVVPMSDPDLGEPAAEVKITAPYGRIFVNGSTVYLASRDWRDGRTKVTVVDFATPTSPRVRGEVDLPEQVAYWGYGGDWYGGDEVVQVGGSKLVFHSYRYWYRAYDDCYDCAHPDDRYDRLYVVDLSNPDAPSLASTLVLRDEDWIYGLKARGQTLYFTHNEVAGTDARGRGLARYYLDRVDLGDPAHPRRLAKINIPGVAIDLSQDQQIVYTLDYEWRATGDWAYRYAFNALRLVGRRAVLQDRLYLDTWPSGLSVSGNAAFFVATESHEATDGTWVQETSLRAIDLHLPGQLHLAGSTRLPSDWGWLRGVAGGRAFVDLGWLGGLLVYDVSDPAAMRLESFDRSNGWVYAITVSGQTAYLAKGYYGVSAVPLSPVL